MYTYQNPENPASTLLEWLDVAPLLVKGPLLSQGLRMMSETTIGVPSKSKNLSLMTERFARWILPTNASPAGLDVSKLLIVKAHFNFVISERTQAFWDEYRQGREIVFRRFLVQGQQTAERQRLVDKERRRFDGFADAWIAVLPSWQALCDGPLSDNALWRWIRIQKRLETIGAVE